MRRAASHVSSRREVSGAPAGMGAPGAAGAGTPLDRVQPIGNLGEPGRDLRPPRVDGAHRPRLGGCGFRLRGRPGRDGDGIGGDGFPRRRAAFGLPAFGELGLLPCPPIAGAE